MTTSTPLLRSGFPGDRYASGRPSASAASRISAAKPKIADYPFTTLEPHLGVVRFHEHEFVLADIPGLIEGAHEGAGLGDRFLGHVERCRVLLHLIDATCEHAGNAYKTVRTELEAYEGQLAEKIELVALTAWQLLFGAVPLLGLALVVPEFRHLRHAVVEQFEGCGIAEV